MPDRRGDGGRPDRGDAAAEGSAAAERCDVAAEKSDAAAERSGAAAKRCGAAAKPHDGRLVADGGRVESDGGRLDRLGDEVKRTFDPEELRRRNLSAVAIDVLYLFATAFLTTLFVRSPWKAVIAAAPLGALLYFAWRSTTAFLLAQLLVVALTVVATYAGVLPL